LAWLPIVDNSVVVVAGDEGPETQFAWLGEDRIAYQVFGEGEVDVLYVAPLGDAIDMVWYWPPYAEFLRGLGTHARVITFDRRGAGSSDEVSGQQLPSWEQWAEEARAVLDAAGSDRAVVLAVADSGPMALLFAASHPLRTSGLILANTAASFAAAEGTGPWDPELELHAAAERFLEDAWGTESMMEVAAPDAAFDPAFVRWATRMNRLAYRRRQVSVLLAWETRADLRATLESIRVPTLVLHRERCEAVPLEHGQYLASHIPNAQLAVLPGRDPPLYSEPSTPGLKHIEQFLRGLQGAIEPDRALAAVLFTDLVGSTKHLSRLGDRAWRDVLDSHDVIAGRIVERHAGRLLKTTGDGILATFDGPGRAIRCTTALRDALEPLGIEMRAGLHTGEVEIRGDDIAGIAVHIAARVLHEAAPNEIWVSAAVPMLVAGAGFNFDDRGLHNLKGIDGSWQLFAVRV
jgi:class 3 adenylate cyclase